MSLFSQIRRPQSRPVGARLTVEMLESRVVPASGDHPTLVHAPPSSAGPPAHVAKNDPTETDGGATSPSTGPGSTGGETDQTDEHQRTLTNAQLQQILNNYQKLLARTEQAVSDAKDKEAALDAKYQEAYLKEVDRHQHWLDTHPPSSPGYAQAFQRELERTQATLARLTEQLHEAKAKIDEHVAELQKKLHEAQDRLLKYGENHPDQENQVLQALAGSGTFVPRAQLFPAVRNFLQGLDINLGTAPAHYIELHYAVDVNGTVQARFFINLGKNLNVLPTYAWVKEQVDKGIIPPGTAEAPHYVLVGEATAFGNEIHVSFRLVDIEKGVTIKFGAAINENSDAGLAQAIADAYADLGITISN